VTGHRARVDRLAREQAATVNAQAEAEYRAAFAEQVIADFAEFGFLILPGSPMSTPEWWAEMEVDPEVQKWVAEHVLTTDQARSP
jgi:hypothetical protein